MKTKDFLPFIKGDNADAVVAKIEEGEFDVNSQDDSGYTLLMYAVSYHCSKTIKALLNLGANPFLVNDFGSSALSLSLKESEENIAKLFLQQVKEKLDKSPVLKYLDSENENGAGAFCYSIASDISQSSSQLRKVLGSKDAAQVCYIHVVEEAEALGQDVSELAYSFDD